ncbi:MAG: riboflavin synthase [Proteobacteria bacterium]|nr:riboflavin synthase [Pseudomonadota bacterium]
MFSGIIQCTAYVHSIKQQAVTLPDKSTTLVTHGLSLLVDQNYSKNLQLGASCAINGACLTLAQLNEHPNGLTQDQLPHSLVELFFDLTTSTINLTNLGALSTGDLVHFERSLTASDENGGHIISGHVSGQGICTKVAQGDFQDMIITFMVDKTFGDYIVDGGYLAVEGCSLTPRHVTHNDDHTFFSVNLVKTTIDRTLFGQLKVGDRQNIEVDTQTKPIVLLLKQIQQLNLNRR